MHLAVCTRDVRRGVPQFKKGSTDGIDYDGAVTTEDLIRFLKKEGGVHIGLAGTLQDFDELAAQFKTGDKPSILAKAEAKLAGLSGEQKVSADQYIKVRRSMYCATGRSTLSGAVFALLPEAKWRARVHFCR